MLLSKQIIVFFNLKKFPHSFCNVKVIYYFINNKLIVLPLVSFNQVLIGPLKLNWGYKLKLITLSLKNLDTFLLLLLEKLSILKVNLKLSYLPKQLNIITVLRSPFIYKKTQDQLIIKHHKSVLYFQYGAYNFFYQQYLEFVIKNLLLFLLKIQYNEIFLWNIKD